MVVKKKSKTIQKPRWHKSSYERIKEDQEKYSGDDRWWKPKAAKSVVRVLPPWSEKADGRYYLRGGLHYGFSVGGRDRAFPCLEISDKGKCPACIVVRAAKENGDHDDLVNRLRVRIKFWVNLIDRKNPEKVLMYGMSKKSWKVLQDAFDDEDYGDPTDPEEGYDLVIGKEGQGIATRYTERLRPKSTPLCDEDQVDSLLEQMHDLDTEVLEFISAKEMIKHLKANFGDVIGELGLKFGTSSDDDDEDEKPKKKVTKKVVKKKPKDEDEDEEDDDDEDEDEDDDDEDDD